MAVIKNRAIVAGDAPKAAYVVYERCEPGGRSAWVVGPLLRPQDRWESPWPGRQGAIEFAQVNLRVERPEITRFETHPWPVA